MKPDRFETCSLNYISNCERILRGISSAASENEFGSRSRALKASNDHERPELVKLRTTQARN